MPRSLLTGLLLLCSGVAAARTQAGQPAPPQAALETGKILDHISCAQHPGQTYALYLPSNYSPTRRWPIVYSFDPGARGTVPVELQKAAAERYGYILAASNNSRNGSWSLEREAAEAVFRDTNARFPIDEHAIYFAGFSGGARVASQLALVCNCAAGVLLSGAGFPTSASPIRDAIFEVFSTVGTLDFNYQEVVPLQEKLRQAGYPHWLYIFEGSHAWASADAMEQALAWFRVQAMKANRQPRDDVFLTAQFSLAVSHANSGESSGELLRAWREYLQIIDTFDGLADVSSVRAKAESLGKQKSVREAVKQESKDFDEETRLTSAVLSGPSASLEALDTSSSPPRAAVGSAHDLRLRAEQEKRTDRARVYKRALAGAFIGAMESGGNLLESHDYARAIRAFSCATEARPSSEWAWRNLAVANSLAGDRKKTLAALKQTRDVATDKTAFFDWARNEPAFDRLRSTPEFQSLLAAN